MLPGLRALHADMTALAPDHAPIVASMIKEFEDKVDINKVPERWVFGLISRLLPAI